MTRIKRGTISAKGRRKVLREVKGFRGQRKHKEIAAKEALLHARKYAFAHRRRKKGVMRRAQIVSFGSFLREKNLSYSKTINALKNKNVELNRLMLSNLAEKNPMILEKILREVGVLN